MIRRIEGQPDDIRAFRFEIGIIGVHMLLEAVRLQAGTLQGI